MTQSKKGSMPRSNRPSPQHQTSAGFSFSTMGKGVISKIKTPFFFNKKTINQEKFSQSPQAILNLAAKGKQILIKNSEGKIRVIIGTTGRKLFPDTDLSDLLGEDSA
jgi:hypothetical protein